MPRAKTMAEIGRELDAVDNGSVATETPGINPPEGVSAQVETKIRYTRQIDPQDAPGGNAPRGFSRNDLEALAAEEAERLAPVDPLSAFLEEWTAYAGYNCMVLRLPDPSTRRMVGQTYVRPHFGPPEQLGAITFDPNPINFVATLQTVNQDSGGNFQLWLVDQYGQRVPDAILYSIAIADPPRGQRYQQPIQSTPDPRLQDSRLLPQRREETEEDREMREFRKQLMQTAMQRLLNPPAPPIAAPTTSAISPEDQAKLYLLGQAPQLFPNMFGQLAEMQKTIIEASANAAATKEPTWKERGIEAVVSLAERNPAIIERLSGTLERVISLVLPAPNQAQYFAPQTPAYLPPQPPQTQPQQPPPLQNTAPETSSENEDEDGDPDIMDILDRLITLINSRKVITANDPVFAELQRDYPLRFRMAVRLIAAQPLDSIIEWVKAQSELYESLLTSEITGEFLRGRIGELQIVFQQAIAGSAQQQQPNANETPTTDTSETESE